MQEEDRFMGAQSGNNKEPDFSVTTEFLQFHTLVVDSGWPKLHEHMAAAAR